MLSAVSNSNPSGLAQWLQSIQKQQASQLASGSSIFKTASQPGATPSPSQSQAHKSSGSQATNSQLFTQIRQAVTTALQISKNSGSTTNPNQVVENSIANLLKNLGFGGSAAASTLAAAESNGQGPEQTGSPNASEGFQKLLSSVGITPQQFRSDFLAAVQSAQSGSANPSSAFKNFPTGNILDVTG